MSSVSLQGIVPQSRLGAWWRRWRYHLTALLIVLPFAYTPHYMRNTALRGGENAGLHSYGPIVVGPWNVTLYDVPFQKPVSQGPAGYAKGIYVAPCTDCVKHIRALFLRIGKPRSARAYGAAAGGNPHRAGSLLLIPPRATRADELWITAEGWDGSVHQASVPLAEASPSIVAWLKNRGGSP
jgi:hypothetical protein